MQFVAATTAFILVLLQVAFLIDNPNDRARWSSLMGWSCALSFYVRDLLKTVN